MAKTTKINDKAQARIDNYVRVAELLKSGTKAQVRKELLAIGYTADQINTPEKVAEVVKVERAAHLHRARAVRSSAKRAA